VTNLLGAKSDLNIHKNTCRYSNYWTHSY